MKKITLLTILVLIISCGPQITKLNKNQLGKNNAFLCCLLHYTGSSSAAEIIGTIAGGSFDINRVTIDTDLAYIPSLNKYRLTQLSALKAIKNVDFEIEAFIDGAKSWSGYSTKDIGKVNLQIDLLPDKMYAIVVEVDKENEMNWVDLYELDRNKTEEVIDLTTIEDAEINIYEEIYYTVTSANKIKSNLQFIE